MAGTADVIVIGSGVIGSSIAYELARRGRQVTVVDRGLGAGTGSTSASSAVIRFNYSTWTGVAAAWESKFLWDDWESFLGGTDDGALARYHRTGGLCLDAPELPTDKVLSLFDQIGVPYEVWTPAQVAARFPGLDTGRYYPPKPVQDDSFWDEADGVVGGYFTPDSGFVDDPAFAAHNLMVAAQRHGAQFCFRTAVTRILRDGGAVTGIELADQSHVLAPVVINAAGPHSAQINELAGVLDDFVITTAPMRQEVHEIPMAPGAAEGMPLVADLDLGTYFRPTPSGNLIVGGTEPACDRLQWLEDPDDFLPIVTAPVYEAQAYRAARRLPELTVPPNPRGIVGVYDVSTDWVPIYDKTALDGFYVAIGTSGNQFKNAPVVGRFIATIMEACEAGQDTDTMPAECLLERTGLTVDLSQYSRKRSASETSGTVMG